MTNPSNLPDLPDMSEPAGYRIRVKGRLASNAARRLHGMSIETECDVDGHAMTTLTGVLPDQAALRGVLHALYSWMLPIQSVELIEAGD